MQRRLGRYGDRLPDYAFQFGYGIDAAYQRSCYDIFGTFGDKRSDRRRSELARLCRPEPCNTDSVSDGNTDANAYGYAWNSDADADRHGNSCGNRHTNADTGRCLYAKREAFTHRMCLPIANDCSQ